LRRKTPVIKRLKAHFYLLIYIIVQGFPEMLAIFESYLHIFQVMNEINLGEVVTDIVEKYIDH
jgi:hypothetical protein